MQTRRADLVMVDLRMPDVGGLDVLRAIRDIDPHCQAVLMTGYASVDTAVEAIKLGAMDYLSKPLDFARLEQLLAACATRSSGAAACSSMEGDLARRLEFCGMIGRGPLMQELFGMIRRLAPHVRTALITGETGTGKELVARALHSIGPRRDRRFVTVNCSAVVETLFESELFGHVRGAFTGATENKPGLFELADGGTLFLDEIGELPLTVAGQAAARARARRGAPRRLARAAARQRARHRRHQPRPARRSRRPAGSAATSSTASNIVEVKLPPLRDRREDIPYLTAAFVREIVASGCRSRCAG